MMSKHSSPARLNKAESRKGLGGFKRQQTSIPDFDISISPSGNCPAIPWPEWNDGDINNERWDQKVKEGRNNITVGSNMMSIAPNQSLFEDDQEQTLPFSLKVHEWKRPSQVFPDEACYVLFNETEELSAHDLVSVNQHIIHSEFIRWTLAAITTLWYLGTKDPFPIEGETSTFSSNTKNLPWRPWHHIYSLCKAGKNHSHNPQINPKGKYVVRLYFMGCWRKILVDDKIPVDVNGNVLLPLTPTRNELWAFLLTKAMLKLSCLTSTNAKELVDFNPVSCMTGWIVQECSTKGMADDMVWETCKSIATFFSVPNEKGDSKLDVNSIETTAAPGSSVLKRFSKINSLSSNVLKTYKTSRAIGSMKDSKRFSKNQIGEGTSKKTSLGGSMISTRKMSRFKQSIESSARVKESRISTLTKMSNFDSPKEGTQRGSSRATSTSSDRSRSKMKARASIDEKKLNTAPILFANMSQNWPNVNVQTHLDSASSLSHPFLILQSRDTPFACQKPRPGIPGWKRFRWLDWANKKGIFSSEMLLPFRSLQIVSVFSEWFAKIEEKENHDGVTRTVSMESIHASGDPGSSYLIYKLQNEEKMAVINETCSIETNSFNSKLSYLNIKDMSDGNVKEERKLSKSVSKQLHSKTRSSYLVTKPSHNSMRYEKSHQDEEPANAKTGNAIWTDFNHICRNLDKILVFYKSSGFRYKINIANFILNRETPLSRTRSAGEKRRNVDAGQNIVLPYNLQRSRNDGLYILFDSVECINVMFMLSTLPGKVLRRPKNSPNTSRINKEDTIYLTNEDETMLRKKARPVNVMFEAHNWQNNHFNNTVELVLETVGVKSATLKLGKGRHVIRLWIKSDTAFVLNCLSESVMVVGSLSKIEECMCINSERVTSFCQQMRNKLSQMILSFGKQHFASALHALFQNINDFSTTERNKSKIHEVFMDAVVATLKHFMNTGKELDEYVFALRVLLMNGSLGLEKRVKPTASETERKVLGSVSEGESQVKQSIDYEKYTQELWEKSEAEWLIRNLEDTKLSSAAFLIQATWKRHCAIKLMNLHRNTHTKEHKQVVEKLKKINETLFSTAAYGDVISRIVRTMFALERNIGKWLPLYHDLGLVLNVEECRGLVVNISANTWIPIMRMIVRCHSEIPIPCAVNAKCQFSIYMVRVIDNDNSIEKPRHVFNVEPTMYCKNQEGYTIFVYAWSETSQKEAQWKLQIITLKNSPYIHSCNSQESTEVCTVNKPPTLMTLETSNFYIPNRENLMCRLLIRVKKKILVSFRLSSSFNGVKFTVSLQDQDGFPLTQTQAEEGAVIIPAALLVKKPGEKETLYILEAKVIKDSWPLTRQEWVVQERLKNEYIPHIERTVLYKAMSQPSMSFIGSLKMDSPKQQTGVKKKKDTQREFKIEKPFWSLQTVIDYQHSDVITVKQDRRRQEAFVEMKRSWERADPGRAKRAKAIRNCYIEAFYGIEHDKFSSQLRIQTRSKIFGKRTDSRTKIKEVKEDSTERFLNPPEEFVIAQNEAHFLKAIGEYFVDTGGQPEVKTKEMHEMELLEKRQQEEAFEERHNEDVKERVDILNAQRKKHRIMNDYYAKVRCKSSHLMEAAYKIRDDYVRKKVAEEEEKARLEALLKKQKKKKPKKSSRKTSAKKKDKKSAKSRGSSARTKK